MAAVSLVPQGTLRAPDCCPCLSRTPPGLCGPGPLCPFLHLVPGSVPASQWLLEPQDIVHVTPCEAGSCPRVGVLAEQALRRGQTLTWHSPCSPGQACVAGTCSLGTHKNRTSGHLAWQSRPCLVQRSLPSPSCVLHN